MDAEVIVVGGGIAGSAAALALAQRGHDVIVLDRAQFPREKVCGEGLMPHGVAALRSLGIDPRPLGRPFVGIAYHAAGRAAVGRFPDGPGVGVRRWRLDAAVHAAAAAVCDVRLGETVTGIGGFPGRMEVHTRGGTLTCRAIVGADGLHSRVRRWAGLHRETAGRPRYGVRAHLQLAEGTPDRDVVDVYVGERAELYLTPTAPGETNVAALLEEDAARELRGDPDGGLRRIAAHTPAAERLRGAWITRAAVTGPLRQRPAGVVADGVVLVGDAAGFVDAITGEGMSIGVRSALLAAEVLSDGLRSGRLRADHLARYPWRRRRELAAWTAITEVVLWGIRRPRLAGPVVGALGRRPAWFGALLGATT